MVLMHLNFMANDITDFDIVTILFLDNDIQIYHFIPFAKASDVDKKFYRRNKHLTAKLPSSFF